MKSQKYNFFILIVAAFFITLTLWLMSKPVITSLNTFSLTGITQIAALLGTTYLSIELVFISRAHILKRLIGPLDKLYKYHRYLSIFSAISLIIHAISLIIAALPNLVLAQMYILPSIDNLTYSTGIIALYAFITTITISLYIKLPYNIWKTLHRIFGLSVLLATYHIFTIGSSVSTYLPLKLWIFGSLLLGVASLLYKIFFYKGLSKTYHYTIDNIELSNSVLIITMRPIGQPMQHKYGQFAYFTFINQHLSTEEHPFSILSTPGSTFLRIGVKKLGDYTDKMGNLKIGDEVLVKGSYGSFGENYGKYKKEIWIGAGIGITPFLSFDKPGVDTHLYYCTKNKDEAIFLNYLNTVKAKANTKLKITNNVSQESGRLNPEIFLEELKNNDTVLRICGPQAMAKTYDNFFEKHMISKDRLIYEDFNLLGN